MSHRRVRNVRTNSFTSGRTPSPPSSTMADPPKSASPFSFGQPATSGGASGLFGQTVSSAPKQGGGLFGSSANPPTTSAANPFGNTSIAGGTSTVFGGGGGSNPFGGASKSSTGFSFGPAPSNNTSGGLFGSSQPGPQNNQPSTSASSSTAFSALSTPNKSSEQPSSGQTQTSNLFGGGGSSGGGSTTSGFFFGNLGPAPSQRTSTTPTSKPAATLFDNSTTPAGPPPSNNSAAGAGSALLGRPRQDASNPFSNLDTSSSAQEGTATAAQSSPFSGFTVGASKPQETPAMTSATQTPSLFGSTPNAGTSNIFGGNKRAAQPEGGFFGNLNKTQDTGANKPGISQQPQSEASKSSLFNLGGQQPTNTSAAPSTSASLFGNAGSPKAFSFAEATQSQPPKSNTVTPSTVASGGSDLFRRPTSSATSAPSTSAPAGGMFSNLGKSQDKAPTSAAGTTAPSSSAPAPTSSLFAPKPADPISTSQAPSQAAATGTAYGTEAAPANLGASTAGPAPPAQSRLKNKSMDDIITRWASDLSKYQKEFHQQAEKVAAWDQMLVMNSEKIQKLYGSTLEAERATTEVERQLTAVENDQAELSMWLDHYEKEVDAMISSSVGQDTLSGPDQERERT